MRSLPFRRALVALAALVTVVAVAPAPASADGTYTFGVDAASITLYSQTMFLPDLEFDLIEEPETDECETYDPDIDVDIEFSNSTSTYADTEILAMAPRNRPKWERRFTAFGNRYQFEVSLYPLPPDTMIGQIIIPFLPVWAQKLWQHIRIYRLVGGPPACTKQALVCSLVAVYDSNYSNDLIGTYSGTIDPTATTTGSLAGTGIVVADGECDAAFAGAFDGSTADFAMDLSYPA